MGEALAKFKTVKRKAEVGERILITNRIIGTIRNGDVGVVDRIYDNGDLDAVIRNGKRFVYDCEYEVIIEEADGMNFNELTYDQLAEHVEKAVRALKERSYHEGYTQGKFDASMDAVERGRRRKSATKSSKRRSVMWRN